MRTIDHDIVMNALNELLNKGFNRYSRPQKTREIKDLFARFFQEKDYGVYANKINDESGLYCYKQEYVFDLIVLEEEETKHKYTPFVLNTVLALETELKNDFKSVVDDFQKLLISNAEYKVLVFNCHTSELDGYLEFMTANMDKYKSINGKFFIICFYTNKNEVCLKCIQK